MKEFIFTWHIENISYSWHQTGEEIISPTFSPSMMSRSSWTLHLYPRGETIGDFLSLYLQRNNGGQSNMAVNFELACITSSGKSIAVKEFSKHFREGEVFGHPRFLGRNEVFFQKKVLYLPEDIFTIRCRMWTGTGKINQCAQCVGRTHLYTQRNLSVESIGPFGKEKTFHIHSEVQKDLMSIQTFCLENKLLLKIVPVEGVQLKFSVCKLSLMDRRHKCILREHKSIWVGQPRAEFWRMPLPTNQQDKDDKDSFLNNMELVIDFVYSTGMMTKHLGIEEPQPSRMSEFILKYITSCIPSGNLSDCPRISHDLWKLYTEQVLCDVELKTQTTSFFAHKIVLCARSPVFLAMLTGDLKETTSGCIEIEDITDDILKIFLFFLYNDCFEDLEWDAVIGLYYAADKYHIERLKILCCSYLMKNIDFNNVCELLILSDRHNDSDFKRRVEDFILQNREEVFNSLTWKQFVKEQPFLPAMTMLLQYDNERDRSNSAESYDDKLINQPAALDDFQALYQGPIVKDVVIKTAGGTFPAHKTVLFASSSTLRERFKNDLSGISIDSFEMEDLDGDTVSQMLLFLYTDSLGDIQSDAAIKLYRAAGIYQIQRLKIKCACFLLENLETSNAIEILDAANEFQDTKLKAMVEDFIILHDEEIFGSDEWNDFSNSNYRLANETMISKYRKQTCQPPRFWQESPDF